MLRIFTIIAVVWRFRLDDIILSAMQARWARVWRRVLPCRQKITAAVRLRLALEYLGPIFVKFGQLLSTRGDLLPPDFIVELSKLQDQVPPESTQTIQSALATAYDQPLTDIFANIDDEPVGSASVAQVHRAILKDSGQEVAIKILRPNVFQRIRRDLYLLESFAWCAEMLLRDGRRLHPRELVSEFARHLDNETHLLREAAHCSQIGRNFIDSPLLVVPQVYWQHCRDTVMVMEYLKGTPISDVDTLRTQDVDLSALAKNGVELFFTQVFRDNLFHADMHPGNVHVDSQGRFILLDYGIVGGLADFDKEYLARNFIAFFNRDYRAVAQMHVDAGWTPPDTPVEMFADDIRAVCEPVFAKPLKDISFGRLLLQMFRVARRFELEAQPQLFLLQKTLLNVEGMGRNLDPNINLWDTAKPFLENWAKQQYSLRRALRMARQQAPDWMAILNELPTTARAMLAESRRLRTQHNEVMRLQTSRRRWRWFALAMVLLLVILLPRAIA